jgi:hypothetical protein
VAGYAGPAGALDGAVCADRRKRRLCRQGRAFPAALPCWARRLEKPTREEWVVLKVVKPSRVAKVPLHELGVHRARALFSLQIPLVVIATRLRRSFGSCGPDRIRDFDG